MATRMFCHDCRIMVDANKAPGLITFSCGHTFDVPRKSGDVNKEAYFPDHNLPPSEYLAKPDYGVRRPR